MATTVVFPQRGATIIDVAARRGVRRLIVPILNHLHPIWIDIDTFGSAGPANRTVSRSERRHAQSLPPRRAAEFLRGRAVLRGLVTDMLSIGSDEVEIRTEPGGRPSLVDLPVGVSITHTASHVAAALWRDGDVGLDLVEPLNEPNQKLIRRCCHRRREEVLELIPPDRALAFARVWAVQEACVKSLGQGLSSAPWRIPVDPFAGHGRWGEVIWRVLETGDPTVLAVAGRHPRR